MKPHSGIKRLTEPYGKPKSDKQHDEQISQTFDRGRKHQIESWEVSFTDNSCVGLNAVYRAENHGCDEIPDGKAADKIERKWDGKF